MIKPILHGPALQRLILAVSLAFSGTSQAQITRINPALIMPQADQTLTERVNQLAAAVTTLKAQLAADETKLAAAAQAANDAKLGVSFTVSGVNNQLNKIQSDLSTLQASSSSLNTALQNQLNTLQSTFASHTHEYGQTFIDYKNVPLGGTAYASLIVTDKPVTETTSPPK